MGTVAVKTVPIKPNIGRGSVEAHVVLEALRDNWTLV